MSEKYGSKLAIVLTLSVAAKIEEELGFRELKAGENSLSLENQSKVVENT
ncbi:hypothetical protein DY000_02043406 [Brassica cretica]|uniref:Uncharacterized protein n=1 Tax=Brassica cretica TaxID=69181 RepID=A0ABQ7BND8_BRACR|nr:hypothetical protein DY000_02043406 [Brassica cretica]